jgi:hypothetical protein
MTLKTLLDDAEIRAIVDKWFPVSEDSLKFAYHGDIKEVARARVI